MHHKRDRGEIWKPLKRQFPQDPSETAEQLVLDEWRSRRTGAEDRSCFGRLQAIRKGGRECRQQQGDERVENAGLFPAAPPS